MNKAGVKVFLNREVSLETVEEMKPDAVVVATGAAPIIPDIPGIHGKNVVLAQDVLTSKVDMGQEVVIIGGGLAGLETALFLAEQGKRVSVVEMKKIAWDIDNHHKKLALMELLTKYGVYMYTDSTLDSVTEKGVNVFWDSGLPPTKEWVLFFLKADTVVLAVGSVSENKLAEKLSGVRSEVYTIGDCVQPRNVLAATQEGDEIGRRI
ncbi:MAG: FAD-dependent oxidoreductase [Chloroflexi bacterium]|nr:FAD-dependent oxidoreductase [Chloroflexota bacterium]